VADPEGPLPINWQLRFVHNQLFKLFQFPSRFCPGAFHSTIVRKAEFRSSQHRNQYFAMCDEVVQEWKKEGVKPLVPAPKALKTRNITVVNSKGSSDEYQSGLWLFTDRENITHFFPPNFLPPYDTPEKKSVILEFLGEEWDEKKLCWKKVEDSIEEATTNEAGCSPSVPKVDRALNRTVKKVDHAFDETVKYLDGLIDRMFEPGPEHEPGQVEAPGLYSIHKFTQ
jgi:hypothetical protein